MSGIDVFVVFLVCHVTGDFLLQTDWQANNKRGGLGRDPVARRALASHIAVYTLVFLPALAWAAHSLPAGIGLAALIALPHWVQDDGRCVAAYAHAVKGSNVGTQPGVALIVDQCFHAVALFGVALLSTT
jgi:hypothetical protein